MNIIPLVYHKMAVEVGPEWTDLSEKVNYGADSASDVLIIVSEDISGPDVVQRRAAIELTEERRGKLENQGIAREDQHDDLSIVKARYSLDENRQVAAMEMSGPGGERLTREVVFKKVNTFMNNCVPKKGGM